MKSPLQPLLPALALAAALALTQTALAATRTWDGSTSGNWSNGANWVGGVAPIAGDSLTFPVSATRYVTTNNFAAGTAFGGLAVQGSNYIFRGSQLVLEDDLRALAASGPVTFDLALTVDGPLTTTQFEARFAAVPTFNGTIQLVNPAHTLQFINGQINVSGAITGAGSVEVVSCDLHLNGTGVNTYTGSTEISGGNIFLNKTVANAAFAPGAVVDRGAGVGYLRWLRDEQIANSAQVHSLYLDLAGQTESLNDFYTSNLLTNGTLTVTGDILADGATLSGDGNGRLNLPAGNHRVFADGYSNIGTVLYELTGPGTLVKMGTGRFWLEVSNSLSGSIIVSNGVLEVRESHALGSTAAGVTVRPGATLGLRNSVSIDGESVTLEGGGFFDPNLAGTLPLGYGALHAISPTNAWNGSVTLNGSSSVCTQPQGDGGTNCTLLLGGVVQGTGTLTKQGEGTVVFTGNSANTFSGSIWVRQGTLALTKSNATAIASEVRVGDVSIPGAEVLRLLRANQIADTGAVIVATSGRWELNGFSETIGALWSDGASYGGEIALGGATLTLEQTLVGGEFGGTITGAGGFTKRGSGSFALNSDNPYTGATLVQQGRLIVHGQQPASPVGVLTSATLAGDGTVGHLTASPGSTIAPATSGASATLTTSNVILQAASTLQLRLRGHGSNDQLRVRGTVTLNSPTLALSCDYLPQVGDTFTLIDNDGGDLVSGTFAGLPGGTFTGPGGVLLEITYGNDVTLRVVSSGQEALPPGIGVTVTGGNGNGAIDPGECNQLRIALANTGTNALAPFHTMLACDLPGVTVTQPASDYPTIAPQAWGTNVTAFQMSTPATLTCGSNLPCRLLVFTTNGGGFEIPLKLPTGTPGVTVRFDDAPNEPIHDGATAEGLIPVAAFGGYLARVEVSAFLEHPLASDLVLTLVAPDGTEIPLAANLGSGANYGTNCADNARVRFADDAATAITTASAPFVGTFRPTGYLNALRGLTGEAVEGKWRLQVRDTVHFNEGFLRCWSLFLTPAVCTDGGGECERCPLPVVASTGLGDPLASGYVNRSGEPSTCLTNTACGVVVAGSYRYRTHTYTNLSGQPTCVTVRCTPLCTNDPANVLAVAAYRGAFDPASVCDNFLGDSAGFFGNGVTRSFSFQVPATNSFQVVVTAINNPECSSYTLEVNSPDLCPVALHISALAPNLMRLDWPSYAGGYELNRSPNLAPPGWTGVTNNPVVKSGRFVVSNSVPETNGFYRLHKP